MSKRQPDFNQVVKMFFGIFMVLVYLAMGVMMALNVFDWANTPAWNAIRWGFAILFAAYGVYRGYRELTGRHTYGMRQYDEDNVGYTTYRSAINDKQSNDDEKE